MSERWGGIYDAPRVDAELDGDRMEVVAEDPGPAGVSAVELPDGSRWEVDHVAPRRLVRIEVGLGDPLDSPLLVATFGADGAMLLADRAHGAPPPDAIDDPFPTAAPRGPRSSPRVRQPLSRPRRSGPSGAEEAGQLVLLDDLATDVLLHPLARIVAAAELVVSRRGTEVDDLLGPSVEHLASLVAHLAATVDDDELAPIDARTMGRVAGLVARAGKSLDARGRGFLDLSSRLHDRSARQDRSHTGDHSDGPLVAAAAPADAELVDHLELSDVFSVAAVRAMPGRPRAQARIRRVEPALVRVDVPSGAGRRAGVEGDRWVRVLRRDGLVPLGWAPLRSGPTGATAEVPVPPDVADDRLVAQVVEGAELAALTGRPAAGVRAAVRAGREASRVSRTGHQRRAAMAWDRCAALWEAAGDLRRADHARDLAAVGGSFVRVPATVADHVEVALTGAS